MSASVDLERTLRAELGPALRARRPAAPADLGRRALAAGSRAHRGPALAAALLVAAAALTLVWRGGPSVTGRPVSSRGLALAGGGESGSVRRLHQRIRVLRRAARQLARDAADLSRRAALAQERAEEALRDIDDAGSELRRVRREETGAAPLERAVQSCGDDPLCPLPPGPELVDPDPAPDFTVERALAPESNGLSTRPREPDLRPEVLKRLAPARKQRHR